MGTRHLVCVAKDGNYKVAQYGQWDGYPSGQGLTLLTFLRDKLKKDKFIENLGKTFQPNDEQIDEMNKKIDESGLGVNKLYPSMSRDTGGDILELIQESEEPVPLRLTISFAAESLFCEYAYVVDLDKNTFEIFTGFNKCQLDKNERFYGLKSDDGTDGYYPVRHVKTYQLDSLPTNEDFLSELEPEDE